MMVQAARLLVVLSLLGAQYAPPDERVRVLIERLKGSYDASSWAAVYELGSIGAAAIPALVEVIETRDHAPVRDVPQAARYQAIFALEKMGPAAEPAIDLLVSLLSDKKEDEGVRWASASALQRIRKQPEKVIPVLVGVLEDPATPYTSLCGYVLGALETYGPHEGRVLRVVKRYRGRKLCGEGGPEM